jgi:thymidine phosphorylase
MQIEVTAEVLLKQLGYTVNDAQLKLAQKVMDNTRGIEKFAKHIFALNDHLQHMSAYVKFSNSQDYLKIKSEQTGSAEIMDEFHEEIKHWSEKYKVEIQQVEGTETYYIIGLDHDA